MKKFLTFLVVLLIVVAVVWVLLFVNKDRILKYTIDKGVSSLQENLVENLPATVQRGYVDSLFAVLKTRLQDGSLRVENISSFAGTYREFLSDGRLDSFEVENLLRELEGLTSHAATHDRKN